LPTQEEEKELEFEQLTSLESKGEFYDDGTGAEEKRILVGDHSH
jgi:hypothetical protein